MPKYYMRKLILIGQLLLLSFYLGSPASSGAGIIKGNVSIKIIPVAKSSDKGGLYGAAPQKSSEGVEQPQISSSVLVYIGGFKQQNSKPPEEMPVLNQKNIAFEPHILPIVVGTTVRFPNSDLVFHNVFSYSKPKTFDLGRYPKGKSKYITFDKPGIVKVFCEIHSQMSAIIIVLENPYFSLTDENGNFSIPDVPPGTYKLAVWHEVLSPVIKTITIKGDEILVVNFDM